MYMFQCEICMMHGISYMEFYDLSFTNISMHIYIHVLEILIGRTSPM